MELVDARAVALKRVPGFDFDCLRRNNTENIAIPFFWQHICKIFATNAVSDVAI